MASPQKENGYTAISNEIVEALAKTNLSPQESKVLWVIFRKTYGYGKKEDAISYSQFEEMTGMNRWNIGKILKRLLSKQIIGIIQMDNRKACKYAIQKDYDLWKGAEVLSKQIIVPIIQMDNETIIQMDIHKRKKERIYTKDDFRFKKRVPIPEDIFLTDQMKEYAKKQGCVKCGYVDELFEGFKNYYMKSGTKWQNWTRVFYDWVRNDKKKYNPKQYAEYETLD